MLANILYFIPSLLCMMWTAVYMTKKKNPTQQMMQRMIFLGSIHYATQGIYISPNTDYKVLCIMDIIEPPLLLTILAMLLLYILRHSTKKAISEAKKIRIFLPAIAFTPLLFSIYYMFGLDNAMTYFRMTDEFQVHAFTDEMIGQLPKTANATILKAFELVDVIIFDVLAGLYCLIITYYCVTTTYKNNYKFGDIIKFWFMGKEIPFVRATSFCVIFLIFATSPPMFIGRSYIVNHPTIGILLSLFTTIAIFFFAYIESLSSEKNLTLRKCVGKAFSEVSVLEVANPSDLSQIEKKETLAAIRSRSLTEKIRVAFEEEKIYKDPDLSLANMAERLNVNRTTLSNTINQQYGMSFREMLNNYRIEAAKEYLQKNPSATQLEIAMACGFKSASSFNHKFKELTGETPNTWLLKN